MFKSYNSLCDVVSLLVYCPAERSFLLLKEANGEFWLPCSKVEKLSWKSTANKLYFDLFGMEPKAHALEPIRVVKVWRPQPQSQHHGSVFHAIYKISIKADVKKKTKPKTNVRCRVLWFNNLELERQRVHSNVKSPELAVYSQLALGEVNKEDIIWNEFDVNEVLIELSENNLLISAESGAGATGLQGLRLLQAAKYDKDDQILLYREFMAFSFPAIYMSPQPFTTFMTELGFPRQECSGLFRAADVSGRGALTFQEFLLWCAAIEPVTQHNGQVAEARCRYIFRFYDANRDGKLEYEQFKELVAAAREAKSLPIDSLNVAKDADTCIKKLSMQPNSYLLFPDFMKIVADQRLRGTSSMIRAPQKISEYLRDLQERTSDATTQQLKGQLSRLPSAGVEWSPSQQHQVQLDYSVATFTVRLRKDAAANEMVELQHFNEDSISPSTARLLHSNGVHKISSNDVLGATTFPVEAIAAVRYFASTFEKPHSVIIPQPQTFGPVQKARPARIIRSELAGADQVYVSTNHVDRDSRSALLLFYTKRVKSALKHSHITKEARRGSISASVTAMTKSPFTWFAPDEETAMGALLLKLADSVKTICQGEPRLLRITSPAYVIGDLHGNLSALLAMEAALWPSGAALSPAKLLFLGDFVDRGPHGSELMAYLMAAKLQRPRGVYLIRGNHETREIQKMFTFYTECITKYGESNGQKIWNSINQVFDVLPLAAVIDDKVFCCHGGIPPPWVCPLITAIEKIPVPLVRPAEQSTLAWELLWNDPVRLHNVTATMALELTANEGFAANSRRGTGHVFDQNAIDRFLLANQLSHVVRAHELHQTGFMCQLRGRLISVFSSSNYCGGTNDSAIAFLEGNKLRLITVDEFGAG